MALLRVTSPHAHGPVSTSSVMQQVLLATIPGILALVYWFGFGVLTNLLLCVAFSVALEAIALKCRGRAVSFYLKDCSALVTAVLLAIALPPASPWWLLLVGCLFSIIFAKHLYGGLGYNPFNPAMVGYVVLLISLPVEMTTWLAPRGGFDGNVIGPIDALLRTLELGGADAVTMATPLDLMKQNSGSTMTELWASNPQFGGVAGKGWEWVNAAFLAGGLWLLYQRIFTWHAPISMLLTLLVMSTLFWGGSGSDSNGSPLFHLFSGATMLGAFFIVTDPVSSAVSNRGRVVYGILIGILLYLIRVWGNYPDAIAFAVLLANFAAPLIDHYTQPRTYGHASKNILARDRDGDES